MNDRSWIPLLASSMPTNGSCERVSVGSPFTKTNLSGNESAKYRSAFAHFISDVLDYGNMGFFLLDVALVYVQFIRAHSVTEKSFVKSVVRLCQWLGQLCVISSSVNS